MQWMNVREDGCRLESDMIRIRITEGHACRASVRCWWVFKSVVGVVVVVVWWRSRLRGAGEKWVAVAARRKWWCRGGEGRRGIEEAGLTMAVVSPYILLVGVALKYKSTSKTRSTNENGDLWERRRTVVGWGMKMWCVDAGGMVYNACPWMVVRILKCFYKWRFFWGRCR